ncbi:MAG: hypothetical protein KDA60_13810, partial [Planctomycetales bacterium]|nr:hypothetical protein [Planctomycetales bacterium]
MVFAVLGVGRIAADEPAANLRLRIAWGGGAQVEWRGSISLESGTFADAHTLSLASDAPGSLQIQGNKIPITNAVPHSYDAVDVSVTAPLAAKLIVDLSTRGADQAGTTLETTIDQLVSGSANRVVDDTGNSILVRRAPGDSLRVTLPQDHVVFRPGELVTIQVAPHLLPVREGTELNFRAQLRNNQDEGVLWEHSQELAATVQGTAPDHIPLAVPLPIQEGVYNLSLGCYQRSRKSLWLEKPIASRNVQLVTIAATEQPTSEPPNETWEPLTTIDPTRSKVWERLTVVPSLHRMRGPLPRSFGNQHIDTVSVGAHTFSRLEPQGWQAFSLPINEPNRPYLIEIAYPADIEQKFGIALIEPDERGQVLPLAPETAIDTTSPESLSHAPLASASIIHWPNSTHVYVLITNRDETRPAIFGKIKTSQRDQHLHVESQAASESHRQSVASFARPIFPETFASQQAIDPATEKSHDDWETFLVGGRRMVEYLRYVGYSAASITVLCEGSAIYPARQLDPTPKYDSGAYFTNAQDPVRKDVLEMLFRLFDRAGLELIPALELTSPLPALEHELRASLGSGEGIRLVSSPHQATPENDDIPTYNILDQRVQRELASAVLHLARRYGHHRSFGGISLTLTPQTPTHLPSAQWGFDRVTRESFSSYVRTREQQVPTSTSSPVPLGDTAASSRDVWIRWRADVVTQFYRELAGELGDITPQAQLYLSLGGLTKAAMLGKALTPSLTRTQTIDQVLLEMGLDIEQLSELPSLVVVRPQRYDPLASFAAQGVQHELETQPRLDAILDRHARRASNFDHQTSVIPLESFNKHSPFAEQAFVWLAPQIMPAGPLNRQRFIHALAASDSNQWFDGGWTVMRGQTESVRPLFDQFRRLPSQRFVQFQADTSLSPVTVRTLVEDGRSYLYLVNDSPWRIETSLKLHLPLEHELQAISPWQPIPAVQRDASTLTWQVVLEPYDMVAATVASSEFRVLSATRQLPEGVVQHLAQRLKELSIRSSRLSEPHSIDVLSNPGFEAVSSPSGPSIGSIGWDASQGKGITGETRENEAHT